MTARQPCPPAPGPLEAYAAEFDACFPTLAQRRDFREYLTGLLLPRDRHKTLTALAGAEPVTQAHAAPVQRLQYFLSEAAWDAEAVNARRLELLAQEPPTGWHAGGVLVVDDTGDRKDGTATAHVARQYLGSIGKVDNGIVAVTTLWTDGRVYYPLYVEPYTPAARLSKGREDPAFRTKPAIALALVAQARAAGVVFRALVADCFYGENDAFEAALLSERLPFVLGRRAKVGHWAPAEEVHTFQEAAQALPRGAWMRLARRFSDGHTETWWAAELTFAGYSPAGPVRAVVATTDRATLPPLSTWYLTTNLPRPGSRAPLRQRAVAPADLAGLVRLYGLRVWVEESYKRVKHELGWADFMVRTDHAIRRHWALVSCAFSFCWWDWAQSERPRARPRERRGGKIGRRLGAPPVLAGPAAAHPRLARPGAVARALLARVVHRAAAPSARGAPRRRHRRPLSQPLPPGLTKYH
jgi:SRSO17 transposase